MFSSRTTGLHHRMCVRPWSRQMRRCGLNTYLNYGLWRHKCVRILADIWRIKTFAPYFLWYDKLITIIVKFCLLHLNYSYRVFFVRQHLVLRNCFANIYLDSFQKPLYFSLDVLLDNYNLIIYAEKLLKYVTVSIRSCVLFKVC